MIVTPAMLASYRKGKEDRANKFAMQYHANIEAGDVNASDAYVFGYDPQGVIVGIQKGQEEAAKEMQEALRLADEEPKQTPLKEATDEAMRAHYLKCVSEGMGADCDGYSASDLMADGDFDLEKRFVYKSSPRDFWARIETHLRALLPEYGATVAHRGTPR